MSLLLGVLLALAPQDGDGPGTPADWARALDDLDFSMSLGEFTAELSGEFSLELLVFDQESPGLTLEDAPLRSDHYHRTRQEDSPEVVARLKLFVDGTWGRWLTWFMEGRADRGAPALEGEDWGARFEQYWVRLEIPDAAWAPKLTLGNSPIPVQIECGHAECDVCVGGGFVKQHGAFRRCVHERRALRPRQIAVPHHRA